MSKPQFQLCGPDGEGPLFEEEGGGMWDRLYRRFATTEEIIEWIEALERGELTEDDLALIEKMRVPLAGPPYVTFLPS